MNARKRGALDSAPLPALRLLAPLLLALCVRAGAAEAADTGPSGLSSSAESRFQEATRALEKGELQRAIAEFELLADQGVLHPDVSYGRGLAYLKRAETAVRKPGDWGQAAAAFAETLALDPEDQDAAWGLEEADLRVAKRRAAGGAATHIDTESLPEKILDALSPRVLWITQALGSALLTLALAVGFTRKKTWRLASNIGAGLGAFVLLLSSALVWARASQLSGTPAVVVAERAPLFDESGRPLTGAAHLLEGQRVRIRALEGRLARVSAAQGDVWIQRTTLRALPVTGR